MKRISLDTNALTFFVNAISVGYDPSVDSPDVAREKIAIIKIFFYTGDLFFIVPTVEKEYNNIKDVVFKDDHSEVHSVLMNDYLATPNKNDVKDRQDYYFGFHGKREDCRILAEAELAGYDVLLTYDKKLINRVKGKTISILLLMPSEYLAMLNIPSGARPVWAPHKTNPLSRKSWWLI